MPCSWGSAEEVFSEALEDRIKDSNISSRGQVQVDCVAQPKPIPSTQIVGWHGGRGKAVAASQVVARLLCVGVSRGFEVGESTYRLERPKHRPHCNRFRLQTSRLNDQTAKVLLLQVMRILVDLVKRGVRLLEAFSCGDTPVGWVPKAPV